MAIREATVGSGRRRGMVIWPVAALLVMAACSSSGAPPFTAQVAAPTTAPPATTVPPATTAAPTTMPGSVWATTPVADIDFDRLYRDLDAVRGVAYDSEDAELLAAVSTDTAEIERLRAEAAETATRWDRSERIYTVMSVEVFHVVDENRVLLLVVDENTGAAYKRDQSGAVVDTRSREDEPVRWFLVLMDRTSGRWKVGYDAMGVPAKWPLPPFVDFAPLVIDDVDGETVTVLYAQSPGNSLRCFLVVFSDPVPQIGCAQLIDYAEDAFVLLFTSPDGAHEAIMAMHGLRTEGAVAMVEPGRSVAVDLRVGTWFVGVDAAQAGEFTSLTWGGTLTDKDGPDDLDELRRERRPGEAIGR